MVQGVGFGSQVAGWPSSQPPPGAGPSSSRLTLMFCSKGSNALIALVNRELLGMITWMGVYLALMDDVHAAGTTA